MRAKTRVSVRACVGARARVRARGRVRVRNVQHLIVHGERVLDSVHREEDVAWSVV